jgi:signal transduction histidine kinase/CheY-like chemotaxis protein
MAPFNYISQFFKKRKGYTGRDLRFEESIARLMDFLLERVGDTDSSHAARATIFNYLKLNTNQKKEKLTQTYLFVEKYLTDLKQDFKKDKRQLRELIRIQFPKLQEIESFNLIFEDEDVQEFKLSQKYLLQIIQNLSDLLGENGSKSIQEIRNIIESAPNVMPPHGVTVLMDAQPKNLKDWTNCLRKLAVVIFELLQKKLGEETAIRRFDTAYQTLAPFYINLDSFQVIVSILPEQLMDESRISALTKHQIEKLLLKKVAHFEKLTEELSIKNKELEKTQRELIQAKNKAESASEAKAMFLANMSHEIRTPMNAVIGMADILKETKPTREQLSYIETISKSGYDLVNIINDILDYSKIESGKLEIDNETINIYSHIEEALSMLALKAHEKGLEILYIIEEDVPMFVKSDPTRLKQVLVNLISNAIKFTMDGYVHIRVHKKETLDSKVVIEYEITDTGIGIPEEKHESIFGSFSQVDVSTTRIFGGTGLGLAISKSLIKMMGGDIQVQSKENKGSVFSFQITVEPDYSHGVLSQTPVFKGKRMLIASKTPPLLKDLEKKFLLWGFDMDCYKDIASLEEHLTKNDDFDVFVIDQNIIDDATPFIMDTLNKIASEKPNKLLPLVPLGSNIVGKNIHIYENQITKPIKRSDVVSQLEHILTSKKREIEVIPTEVEHTPRDIKVLIAEDNITNQLVSRRLLETIGYTIEVANNGQEAIELHQQNEYDLILMDVHMPIIDGLEATKRIRKASKFPSRPIIVAMTANAMKKDRAICLGAGMNDYLSKPVRRNEITQCIEKWFPEI